MAQPHESGNPTSLPSELAILSFHGYTGKLVFFRFTGMQPNGFLYDGSPTPVDARALFKSAREEGKPILKGVAIADLHTPSPHSSYFSHTNKHSADMENLASSNDIDGLLTKLSDRPLSGQSKVIFILASKLKQLDIGIEALKLGNSPLVLSCECLKALESAIGPTYQKHVKTLPHDALRSFGKIIKGFQRMQPHPFTSKATDDNHKVCLKVGMGTFAAALYSFVMRPELYSQDGKSLYNKKSMQALGKPLLQVYKNIMQEYTNKLTELPPTMLEPPMDVLSLKEWSKYFWLRIRRDHKGGHCAAWRDGYPDETQRLHNDANVDDAMQQRFVTECACRWPMAQPHESGNPTSLPSKLAILSFHGYIDKLVFFRFTGVQPNGFLYDGSSTSVDARALFESAREEGKPILKGVAIGDLHTPSPH
ncbi:hypothetical protein L7F22_053213 [Adiantum nelumboides]|nr:hypothetical protein [Adiantum nelumboides]